MKIVIKKDGRTMPYEREKLINSILRAFSSVEAIDEYAELKANNIADFIEKNTQEITTAEEIGDLVERGLMSSKKKNVAKQYVLKRNERDRERIKRTELMRIVSEKLGATNVANQNANVDEHSFGGRKGEASNELMKKYALDNCISEMAKNNHLNNMIYIHDLDSYAVGMHNCLSIPFDKLLANGFNTRQADIRPANSINTAFQLVAVIFQLQSLQQFGGVSATHLDWTMVPYVRKSFYKHYCDGLKYLEKWEDDEIENNLLITSDCPINDGIYRTDDDMSYNYAMDKTKQELEQAVEGMYHNLNTLQSRSGNQLPFTSINYGTCTLPEGQMVIEALINGCKKGVGKFHKTSIFPCGIFQCMKGVNRKPGEPNYYLYKIALECTAQRLYPNYANVDWTGNEGYDPTDPKTYFSTMGCRTANGWDINHDPGVNGQTKDGRGNICPVTIILPTLAMMAKENPYIYATNKNGQKTISHEDHLGAFMHLLGQKIDEAKDMLIERYNFICSQDPNSAKFMYENGVMLGYKPEEGIESALKHGTLALGQLGLAEALQILIGEDHASEFGMKFAKRIERLFRNKCAEFKEQYKLNFGVYYTPAENLCYTAMKKFKKQYGEIPNISDKEFFTNSIHVPVWKEMSPFEKIDIESQLTGYSSAGCITYVELDAGAKNNIEALETIVNYAMDKDIPYFAINVPNDTCLDCGYCDEFEVCPQCGGTNVQHLRRVTGYLTGDYKTAFNPGKQQETELRTKHIKFLNHDKYLNNLKEQRVEKLKKENRI